MAKTTGKSPTEGRAGTPNESGEPTYHQHPADQSFLLQAILDVQKSVSRLEGRFDERITVLHDEVCRVREKLDGKATKTDIRWAIGIVISFVTIAVAAIVGLGRLLSPSPAPQPAAPPPQVSVAPAPSPATPERR